MTCRSFAGPFVRPARVLALGPLAALVLAVWFPGTAGAVEPTGDEKKDAPSEGRKWECLFDGRSLGKWQVIDRFDFSRHGKVYVRDGRLVLEKGEPGTAVRWTGPFPRIDYEISLEAMRVAGGDFFCGLTFPVGRSALTLVVGGWGGSIVGLSSIDGEPAVENETCRYEGFEPDRWYRVRLRVTPSKIEAWLDQKQIIDLATKGRKLGLYWAVEPCQPLGIATWRTTGAIRNVRLRQLGPVAADPADR